MNGPGVVERVGASRIMSDLLGERKVKNGVTNCVNPGHEDSNASMSINLDKGVFKCFACGVEGGCLDFAVLRGVGRDRADAAKELEIRYPSAAVNGTNGHHAPAAAKPTAPWPYYPKTAESLGWEHIAARDGRPGLRCKTWHASGEEGQTKRRYQKGPKGAPTGEFEEGGKPGLLNLRQYLDVSAGAESPVVALVCGETDLLAWTYHAKRELVPIVAVSSSTGETKSLLEFLPAFKGATVYFFPDNDKPGREAAEKRIAELRTVVKTLHVGYVPDPHKDVCDYLASEGASVRELMRIAETPAEEPWPELIPLAQYDRPAFPVDALGPSLAAWVRAVATSLQVPVDLPAMLALPVLAGACARKWEVEIRSGWVEPLNLYCLTALPSGFRKSGVFTEATRIFYEVEAEQREFTKKDRMRAVRDYERAEKKLEQTNNARATAKDHAAVTQAEMQFEKALAEFDSTEKPPAELRLIGDDVTPERVVGILAEQSDRFAIFSPEGGLLATLAGARYSKSSSPNYDALLKAHSGDPISHDRKTADSISVMHPALTLGLAVQPEILTKLAQAPGAKGVGLLARFLYSLPHVELGNRIVRSPGIPDDVKFEYRRIVRRLLEAPIDKKPTTLKFSIYADDALAEFEQEIEDRLKEDRDLRSLPEWASKLAGGTARIAALLALVDREDTDTIEPLDVSSAIQIARYLILHAKAAFGVAALVPEVEVAERLLAWIERKAVRGFSTREAFLALHTGSASTVRRYEDVIPSIRLLVEFGYIRATKPPKNPLGGRPYTDFYQTRPDTPKQAT